MKFTARIIALFTALLMLFSITALALDIPGIGTVTDNKITQLADYAHLTQNTLIHNAAGQQSERYIEWKSGGQLKPVVFAGSSVYGGTMTLDSAVQALVSKGYDVAAGVNGDFFTLSTGVPQGVVVTEGIIRNSDGGMSAIGFGNDGKVFISRLYWNNKLTYADKTFTIDYINKPRGSTGLYLYTPDFGASTVSAAQSTNIIIQTPSNLKLGKSITATVTSMYTGTVPVPLKEGEMCLSAESSEAIGRISSLKAGDKITISASVADTRFDDCDYIIGAYHPLLENGTVVSGLETARHPRTAVGIKSDGTAVFYTVDGRQTGYSAGLGLNEVAERLKAIGCVSAIELDGGASTDMMARKPGEALPVRLGKPSDGVPRKCATFVMFVNNADYTQISKQLYIKPELFVTLPGGEVNASKSLSAIDTNYHPLALGENLVWSSSNPQSSVPVQNGVFSALSPGVSKITVSDAATGASGSAEIMVAAQPDSIKIISTPSGIPVTELNLDMNETVSLKAIGIVSGVEIEGGLFEWFTQDSGVASVDQTGTVTAGSRFGSTTRLVVGMGNYVQWLTVTVGKAPVMLEDFEVSAAKFSPGSVGAGYFRENKKQSVKYGLFSGAFVYDFSVAAAGASVLTYNCDIPLTDNPPFLSLWIKGDGSGSIINASFTDAAGNTLEYPVATLDFTDYRQLIIPISNIAKINSIKLIRTAESASAGTFYIDQMMSVFIGDADITPPEVSLTCRIFDGLLEIGASAQDFGGPVLRKDNIALTMDGVTIPFTYDGATGMITVPPMAVPEEGYHRITMLARDDYGNYDMVSKEIPQPTALRDGKSYTDIEQHWSLKYVEFLDRAGIFNTAASADGYRYFNPDRYITRADVAMYMSRVLKLDESQWQSVTLPYADLAEIPAESLGAVKALYGNGYMTGQLKNEQLVFGPNTPLTRAESFAVLGRAIPQGIKVTAYVGYADADEIPEYAAYFVELLAGLGIINDAAIAEKVNANNQVTRAEFAKMLAIVK